MKKIILAALAASMMAGAASAHSRPHNHVHHCHDGHHSHHYDHTCHYVPLLDDPIYHLDPIITIDIPEPIKLDPILTFLGLVFLFGNQ